MVHSLLRHEALGEPALLQLGRVNSTHRMKPSDPAPASYESPLPPHLLLRLPGLPEPFTRPT